MNLEQLGACAENSRTQWLWVELLMPLSFCLHSFSAIHKVIS